MASFFTRSSRRLLFWVGLGEAITLLSCVGILFERQIREEAGGTGWIEHTHDVIDELLGMAAALGRLESAQ